MTLEARITKLSQDDNINKANDDLLKSALATADATAQSLKNMKKKLSISYWFVIALSVITFVMGIVLLSVPVAAAFSGDIDKVNAFVTAGFGVVDLAGVFFFRPVDRIRDIMCDMSQIILALDSFQSQTSLRLIEMDITSRASVGKASDDIKEAARNSIMLIQDYCETKPSEQKNKK